MTQKTTNWLTEHSNLLLRPVFLIFGNLFLISAMFYLLTLGRPIPLYLKELVLYSTLLGYASLIIIINVTAFTLRQGKGWKQIALAVLYVTIGIMQVTYIINHVESQYPRKLTGFPGINTDWAIILTAISAFISSITAILSQLTTRKKILADIEIEKQKLELERYKLEIEKGRKLKAPKKTG